jgi:predicted nucleotidyltransferase/DNA-binding XRE family transcriptional regulator
MEVGELIREARRSAGLTQSEHAARAGTSQATFSRYESGDATPTLVTLERLLAAAGANLVLSSKTSRRRHDARSPRMAKLLHRRREVNLALARHGAQNAYVFGSVARGTDTEESDIDIVVDFDAERFGLFPLRRLAEDLSTLVGETVHVAARSLLKSAVLARVHEEQVPL